MDLDVKRYHMSLFLEDACEMAGLCRQGYLMLSCSEHGCGSMSYHQRSCMSLRFLTESDR